MEIFEQYFYDQNQADRNLKNSTEFSNVDEMLDEKVSIFKVRANINVNAGIGILPDNLYRLGMVYGVNSEIEFEQLTEEEVLYLNKSPISKPTKYFPAYVRTSKKTIRVYPNLNCSKCVRCNYIKMPSSPK